MNLNKSFYLIAVIPAAKLVIIKEFLLSPLGKKKIDNLFICPLTDSIFMFNSIYCLFIFLNNINLHNNYFDTNDTHFLIFYTGYAK